MSEDLDALVAKHRLWEAGMRAECDGAEAVAAHAAERFRKAVRDSGLATRLICYVLDSITRALDAFTRWVEGYRKPEEIE